MLDRRRYYTENENATNVAHELYAFKFNVFAPFSHSQILHCCTFDMDSMNIMERKMNLLNFKQLMLQTFHFHLSGIVAHVSWEVVIVFVFSNIFYYKKVVYLLIIYVYVLYISLMKF